MRKTGKIKPDKRINKVIGLTFLFMSFIGFSVYPESHSKYVTKKEEALVYNTNLYKLNQGTIADSDINLNKKITLEQKDYFSDHKTAYLTLSFNRSSVVKNKTDIYYIDIDVNPKSACEIVKITTKAAKTDLEAGKITYTKAQNTLEEGEAPVDPSNKVVIKCNVEDVVDDTGKLEVPIVVTEQAGIQKPEVFTYLTGSYINDNYLETNPVPPEPDQPIIEKDDSLSILDQENNSVDYYYEEFWKWVEKYIANVDFSKYAPQNEEQIKATIKTYIQKVYSEENKDNVLKETIISDTNPWPTLPGIEVIIHETNEGKKFYEYKIDENLIGYALTDVPAGNVSDILKFDSTKDLKMVFSGSTNKKIEEAFKLYLYYLYKEDYGEDMIDKVMNYVGKDAISNVINGSSIIGLSKVNDTTVTLKASIIDHVYNKEFNLNKDDKDKIIRISFRTIQNMKDVFINDIEVVYKDLISENAINAIKNHNDLYKSLSAASVANNNTNKRGFQGAFNDYFMIYDDYENPLTGETHKYYLLINVYSNGVDYNYVTVTKIECDDKNEITFTNSKSDNTKLDITIKHKTNDELDDVKLKLEAYFGTNVLVNPTTEEIEETLEDGTVVTSYKTTYSFVKTIPSS